MVLPAVIFSNLATHPVKKEQFLLILSMLVAGTVSLLIAWAAGKVLKLKKDTTGALMITSAFGSSALLGYPLIEFAFPGNQKAMTDAILISELGVGLPIFTICPVIALYFGSSTENKNSFRSILSTYFRSPIFIAVVLGTIVSHCSIPSNNTFLAPFFEAFRMLEGSLTIIACLILGLQLTASSLKGILPLVIVSAIIQMFIQPFIAGFQANLYHFNAEQHQILILISSMPSAVLVPVFATRFQCASETASSLVFINIILSIIMIPLTFSTLMKI
jgi:predicted permease